MKFCTVMLLCTAIVIYAISYAHGAEPQDEPIPKLFDKDMSVHTYYNIDSNTTEYKRFDIQEAETVYRRSILWFFHNLFRLEHRGKQDQFMRACFMMTLTYRNAMKDIRSYFKYRQLYVDSKEYEIGYVTYEIVYRYRSLLELFHIMHYKYYNYRSHYVAPTPYMFYMYTNILQVSQVIIHLCNMLHEIENKFHGHHGVFDDYHLLSTTDPTGKATNQYKNEEQKRVEALQQYRKELKKRERDIRKKKKADKRDWLKYTIRKTRQPKKSKWPLYYGWSIEDYWWKA